MPAKAAHKGVDVVGEVLASEAGEVGQISQHKDRIMTDRTRQS